MPLNLPFINSFGLLRNVALHSPVLDISIDTRCFPTLNFIKLMPDRPFYASDCGRASACDFMDHYISVALAE